mmetsp:Transcript_31676/g.73989  ORF Transcript_31676/g.73989 Transcript_31676/m.73989 type:complete len:263 (+) Transcript_31676:114-902(+)|eukprot:CAMPEP_0178430714 /NCGR_PEP_ID=MMETSP0689_2-20121128/31464_1 /TAXON_ID=160604 /ORGANISM="Amphidinium massartii, Strain CS-259" /LENGTH=262 /DNA_ID=CAMNT_0020052583 /DNA_START=114 /DNA_END=902 /DNA_ORIENTATION=-
MAAWDAEMGYGSVWSQSLGLDRASIRRGFVRKVYGTVAVQLAATAVIAAPIATASDRWLQAYGPTLLTASLLLPLVMLVAACMSRGMQNLMRHYPTNMGMLLLFTLSESCMVGLICSSYELQSILLCLGVTAGAVTTLTLWAMQTELDTTEFGPQLAAASWGLFAVGLLALLLGSPMLETLYACGAGLLFAAYLVYDTQLIVGNKHESRREFSIDDYAFASLLIYLDIVRMFIYLLQLLGKDNGHHGKGNAVAVGRQQRRRR